MCMRSIVLYLQYPLMMNNDSILDLSSSWSSHSIVLSPGQCILKYLEKKTKATDYPRWLNDTKRASDALTRWLNDTRRPSGALSFLLLSGQPRGTVVHGANRV